MGKKSGIELNNIIQSLLNNEEFLLAVAKQIEKNGFLNKEKQCENDKQNLKDTESSELYNDNLQNQLSVEMNQKDKIENINREKVDLLETQSYDKKYKEYINDLESKQNKLTQENREYKSILLKKDEEINALKNEKKSLEYNFYKLQTENKNLSGENDKLNDVIKKLENELEINNERYRDEVFRRQELDLQVRGLNQINKQKVEIISAQETKINKLNSQFSSIKKSYALFLNLENDIKNDMAAILKGNKIENFVYAGVQYKNIEAIWEYAKNRAVNGQIDGLDKLQNIIINFLDAYNMIYNEPIYKIQDVSIGDEFDEEKLIRGYNSKISGMVSDINLLGYVNVVTGKIVKKSVVRV